MADKIRKSKYTVAEIDAAIDMLLEGYTRDEIDTRLSEIEARLDACNKKNISPDYLSEIEKRLKTGAGVVIEHKDFENLIKVYDRPGALFYCDPPYHKTEKYYDAEFNDSDHERLNNCLKAIKGCFILSYNDDDYIRELYKDFNIMAVSRQNNLSRGEYKELIITSY